MRTHAIPGVAVAAILAAAIAAGSRFPWTGEGETAIVRLSWRARGEKVEECRPLTEREQADLPVHMRRSEICEGRVLPYALRVAIDGKVVVSDMLHGAGAREDRPVYVFREIRVEPGIHSLRIDFERLGPGVAVRREAREDAPGSDEAGEDHARPEIHDAPSTPSLSLETRIALDPREVVLVTHDPERARLVVTDR